MSIIAEIRVALSDAREAGIRPGRIVVPTSRKDELLRSPEMRDFEAICPGQIWGLPYTLADVPEVGVEAVGF